MPITLPLQKPQSLEVNFKESHCHIAIALSLVDGKRNFQKCVLHTIGIGLDGTGIDINLVYLFLQAYLLSTFFSTSIVKE